MFIRPIGHFISLAGSANETVYVPVPGDGRKGMLKQAKFTPSAALATDATNYITVTLTDGTTTLGSFTTNSSGGAALVAGTAVDLGATALVPVTTGTTVFQVQLVKNGTGGALRGTLWGYYEELHQ